MTAACHTGHAAYPFLLLLQEGRAAFKYFGRFQAIMRGLLVGMRRRLGDAPPESDASLGAHMLRLRDPKSGRPLPDERLLPVRT